MEIKNKNAGQSYEIISDFKAIQSCDDDEINAALDSIGIGVKMKDL